MMSLDMISLWFAKQRKHTTSFTMILFDHLPLFYEYMLTMIDILPNWLGFCVYAHFIYYSVCGSNVLCKEKCRQTIDQVVSTINCQINFSTGMGGLMVFKANCEKIYP